MRACDCQEDDEERAVAEPGEAFHEWCQSHGMSRYNEHWAACRTALRNAYSEYVVAALDHAEDVDALNAALDKQIAKVSRLRNEMQDQAAEQAGIRTSDIVWSWGGLGMLAIACAGSYLLGVSLEREMQRQPVTAGPAVTIGEGTP